MTRRTIVVPLKIELIDGAARSVFSEKDLLMSTLVLDVYQVRGNWHMNKIEDVRLYSVTLLAITGYFNSQ